MGHVKAAPVFQVLWTGDVAQTQPRLLWANVTDACTAVGLFTRGCFIHLFNKINNNNGRTRLQHPGAAPGR